MNVCYISSIHYILIFLPHFIQSSIQLVKMSVYQIFNIPYISVTYFIIFVIVCSV
jgi:hypothetical protein